ncbi:hypothetical protein Tco_0463215 [Tanacetum coccineum]
MVACLEKTEGNSDFHEIVDFLASSSIHHALTVSPPIYTSYIEQFWNTASSQTVNDVKQIDATVDSKAVVVTEASIRSSLLFNDADGTVCLTNEAIFQNLALMGYEGSGEPTEPQTTPSPTQPSTGDQPFETSPSHTTTQDSRDTLEGTNRNERDQVQTPHDSPLSGGHTSNRAEGALNLQELSVLCTNLSNKVLALESIKDAQAAEISALKSRIKKLEKKCNPSISHHRAWLKSVKRLSMKKRFGKQESDQDADHGIEYMETKEAVDEGRQSDEIEEVNLIDDIEVVEDKGSGDKGGNAEELVSTTRPEVSTARPDIDAARPEDSAVEPRTLPTITSIFDDEDITMAQTLIKMKEEKAKEKGVSFKDIENSSRPERSILTLKPLPIIDPKDKGKITSRLASRGGRERQREEETSKAAIAEMYDEVQAGIDADALFVAKLQQEEREEYTIEKRAKFLAETIAAQRKFRVAQRSAEIRSRPPTKSQLRNLMMTYLKNMGGYKHS